MKNKSLKLLLASLALALPSCSLNQNCSQKLQNYEIVDLSTLEKKFASKMDVEMKKEEEDIRYINSSQSPDLEYNQKMMGKIIISSGGKALAELAKDSTSKTVNSNSSEFGYGINVSPTFKKVPGINAKVNLKNLNSTSYDFTRIEETYLGLKTEDKAILYLTSRKKLTEKSYLESNLETSSDGNSGANIGYVIKR